MLSKSTTDGAIAVGTRPTGEERFRSANGRFTPWLANLCQSGGGGGDRLVHHGEIVVGHAVRWQDVDGVAERSEKHVCFAKELPQSRAHLRKVPCIGRLHVHRRDGSGLAHVLVARIVGKALDVSRLPR